MRFMLTLVIAQGSLFGMTKHEDPSAMYVPEEIWSTIYGFGGLKVIKEVLFVSKNDNEFVHKSKNCLEILKRHLRKQLFKMRTPAFERYENSNAFFKSYAQEFTYQIKNNFFLSDMPYNSFVQQDQDEILKGFQKIGSNFSNWKNISEKIISHSESTDCIAVIKIERTEKKPLNFMFFSFYGKDVDTIDVFLNSAQDSINEAKSGKNIIILHTSKNYLRDRIFSLLPNKVLQNTKMIHFTKKSNTYEFLEPNDNSLPEMPIISDQMKLCKNIKVITMDGMNVEKMIETKDFPKIRYISLKKNKISDFQDNEENFSKSLECIDLTDNNMQERKVLTIKETKNGCIVKTDRSIARSLFQHDQQAVQNFLGTLGTTLTTKIHRNNQ